MKHDNMFGFVHFKEVANVGFVRGSNGERLAWRLQGQGLVGLKGKG